MTPSTGPGQAPARLGRPRTAWPSDPTTRLAGLELAITVLEARLRRLRYMRKSVLASERMRRLNDEGFARGPRSAVLPPMSPDQRRLYDKLRPEVGRAAALAEALARPRAA